MSRVGKRPISIPEKVKVLVKDRMVEVEGPKGKLVREIPFNYRITISNNQVIVERLKDDRQTKALHGTVRTLISNMIKGTLEGFEKYLEIVGTGYRAKLEGKVLSLSLGFSHTVSYTPPEGVNIKVMNPTTIRVYGCDKQKVGEVAAQIREIKKPEPYKGKGIRYRGEIVKRKVGKAALGGKG
ncbi:50S ribosomal protein L6 [Candidatus Aerophobetes bacterium]|nr:50S ribosomal protein L6 [Candidatus Aerophobetes bacterium]